MSLDILPTELDLLVLGFLRQADLATVCGVSRNYHKTAEPLLYRNIVIENNLHARARVLLLTLIARGELAASAKSLTVANDVKRDARSQGYRFSDVERAKPFLQQVMNRAVGPGATTEKIRLRWMKKILSDCGAQGSLAVVVYLAINIETISYGTNGIARALRFSKFLRAFTKFEEELHISRRNVRHLNICSHTALHISLPLSLETVCIKGSSYLRMCEPFPVLEQLRTLELVACTLDVSTIRNFLDEGRAPNLTKLVIRKTMYRSSQDYRLLIDILQRNCPKLEVFVFSDLRYGSSAIRALRDLNGFGSLKELRIDLDLLNAIEDRDKLLAPESLLPPNLSTLHITRVKYTHLVDIIAPCAYLLNGVDSPFARTLARIRLDESTPGPDIAKLYKAYSPVPPALASAMDLVRCLAKRSTLANLSLTLVSASDNTMDSEVVLLLCLAAIWLRDEAGLCLRVHYLGGDGAVRLILDGDGIYAPANAKTV